MILRIDPSPNIKEDWFSKRRTVKAMVNFLLLLLAALIGGIMSLVVTRAGLNSKFLLTLLLMLSSLVIGVIVFWDNYEKPKRFEENVISRQARTWGELNNRALEEIKAILKRKLNEPIARALPNPNYKRLKEQERAL